MLPQIVQHSEALTSFIFALQLALYQCSTPGTLKFMVPHHVAKTASLRKAVFAIALKEVDISFLARSVAESRSDRIALQGGTSMHLKLGQGQAEFLLLHPSLDLLVECRAYG